MGSVNLCLALWSSVNEVPSGIVFALFETGTGQRLFPRRMPSFFLVLLERLGISMAVSVGVLSYSVDQVSMGVGPGGLVCYESLDG